MKLEEKLQQVSEATAQVEAKIGRLIAEREDLRSRLAGLEPSLGELTSEQEAELDQAIERLKMLAA
ncbi:hypothetical protein [Paludisphaera soli]|uniref:hypothetical protein n=1 Tax=Paludisphaera soli TaxID=2712865 RepID=UPI0013ED9636|nr:hypothetical protein [Paludisphaera soli]